MYHWLGFDYQMNIMYCAEKTTKVILCLQQQTIVEPPLKCRSSVHSAEAEVFTKEALPLSKFPSLMHLLQSIEVHKLKVQGWTKNYYTSNFSVRGFLDAISRNFGWWGYTDKIRKSPALSAITDEGTDIMTRKNSESVLVKVCDPETLNPSINYLTNLHFMDGTGRGIRDTIESELQKRMVMLIQCNGEWRSFSHDWWKGRSHQTDEEGKPPLYK